MGDGRSPRFALLRFSGELSTKARATRLQFRRRLVHNLTDALSAAGIAAKLELSHTRIFVELPEHGAGLDDPEALRHHPLTRVQGIQSVSFVERHPAPDLESVVRDGTRIFRERVRGRRFAIRARRVGNRSAIPLRPSDVARDLGNALLGDSAGVDLGNPEVTVQIELSEQGAAYFSERIAGPGGLPLGVEGRAIALISGGFDSAVAAWQIQRRGVALDYVFCNLGGPSHLRGVLRVAKLLSDDWSYGHRPKLHVVDFESVSEAIRQSTETRYWQVLLKRMMLRAGEAFTRRHRAVALVTGDAVGQVSSQTLQNLAVVSRATELPILRPLVGMNKEEIIASAERIGTFELSKVVREYCAMVPRKPATRAARSAIESEEARIDPAVLESAVRAATQLDLRDIDVEQIDRTDLAIDHLPAGAILIDLRSLEQWKSGHHPDALHLDFPRAVEALPSLDPRRTYVLCCQFGLMSAHLAELMRRQGLDAYHLRGGQPALMALAKS